jgi:hypothetical protein
VRYYQRASWLFSFLLHKHLLKVYQQASEGGFITTLNKYLLLIQKYPDWPLTKDETVKELGKMVSPSIFTSTAVKRKLEFAPEIKVVKKKPPLFDQESIFNSPLVDKKRSPRRKLFESKPCEKPRNLELFQAHLNDPTTTNVEKRHSPRRRSSPVTKSVISELPEKRQSARRKLFFDSPVQARQGSPIKARQSPPIKARQSPPIKAKQSSPKKIANPMDDVLVPQSIMETPRRSQRIRFRYDEVPSLYSR